MLVSLIIYYLIKNAVHYWGRLTSCIVDGFNEEENGFELEAILSSYM
jgi:hypothetical protein